MILVRHGQSEFNVVYSETRRDPGIEDPAITELGRAQAAGAADFLADHGLVRLIASPYRRALETAAIIAERLNLPFSVEVRVREHYAFSCDIGSPPEVLSRMWPDLDFSHLAERWWPQQDETGEVVAARAQDFLLAAQEFPDRDQLAVITHWGFIRGMTGLALTNGSAVRVGRDGRAAVVGSPDP